MGELYFNMYCIQPGQKNPLHRHPHSAEVLRLNPKFSVKKYAKRLSIRDKAVKERYIDALRKAGLPD